MLAPPAPDDTIEKKNGISDSSSNRSAEIRRSEEAGSDEPGSLGPSDEQLLARSIREQHPSWSQDAAPSKVGAARKGPSAEQEKNAGRAGWRDSGSDAVAARGLQGCDQRLAASEADAEHRDVMQDLAVDQD